MFAYGEILKAIDECGSITRAAEQLCITQPALSIALRRAEEELGVPLCDRGKKSTGLTEYGRVYLKAAQQASALEKEMTDELQSRNRKISGHVRIGAASISMTYLVPKVLAVYSSRYPDVSVEVEEESLITLKDDLRKEELDLVLENDWFDGELTSERLFQNHILYAVPVSCIADEALAAKGLTSEQVQKGLDGVPMIRMQDVQNIPYLSMQPKNEIYARAERYFSFYQCRPRTVMSFNQQLTAYHFAQQGYGAAFVSDTLVKMLPSDDVRLYLFDCPMPERWVAVGYKRNRYMSTAARALIDVAKETLKDC